MAIHERKIVHIDSEKCNGCGLCVDACHEGAIQMVNGKARLISDVYCDGLGDCLGPCPTGAISIVTRKADAYDQEAVDRHLATVGSEAPCGCPGTAAQALKQKPLADSIAPPLPCGCPGSQSRQLKNIPAEAGVSCIDEENCACGTVASELMNWPVKLALIPPRAPYLKGADLILAADCVPVATPDFHHRYLRQGPVAIACPKLNDTEPQIEKLKEIIQTAQLSSLTVVRMQVPCCGGLVRVAEEAIRRSGIEVSLRVDIISADGQPVG